MENKINDISCARKIWFCCGHRLVGHEGKCANVHGHNYTLFAHAQSNKIDRVGRVIDFSVIKKRLNDWLDQNWDHTFVMYEKDSILMPIKDQLSVKKDVFIADFNPTAENMALYLLNIVCPQIFSDTEVEIYKIDLFESENNQVSVSLT